MHKLYSSLGKMRLMRSIFITIIIFFVEQNISLFYLL